MGIHRFDPAVVREAGLRGVGRPLDEGLAAVTDALDERYPGLIARHHPWIYNNAGGAMIQMKLLYASLTEYVNFFGTPVGTVGHSGRHFAEFFDTVIDGEARYYVEGQLERTVYRAGDAIHVRRFEAAGMHVPDHVWMLEYCRGLLPSMLPFGLIETATSTLDVVTAWRTLRIYGSLLVHARLGLRRPAPRP
ncbi:MAG TPA: ERG2 family protein [Vicinamibacteria bacterium]|nr:ERG2 family protein [Vicinamibacteria bacterium]